MPSNLLAGVQLAMTQPIRIDDVVIVESEWDHRGNHLHSKFWNAKVASVTVADAKGHMMEVRRIMSADQGGG